MQIFNQNVLNSIEIRNLNNVHYELYQNSNAIIDENDIKICDDEKKEKKDDENDDDNDEKLKYIFEKKIDFRIWDLQNEVKKKKKKKKNDEKKSEKN